MHRFPILETFNSIYVLCYQILDTPIQLIIWIAESERTFTTSREAFKRVASCQVQPEDVFSGSVSIVVRPDWTAGSDACCGGKADTTVTEVSPVQGLRAVSFRELMLSRVEDVRLPSIAVQKIEELSSMS